MSALAGCTRCGDHDKTGAGPRTTSGVTGPTANALLPRGSTLPPGAMLASARLSQPTIAHCRLGQAAFEQILTVEMRAFAVGRGAGVDDDRLIGLEQAMQVRHRRIEREKIGELERRRLAVRHQRIVAAQRDPIRIADRRDGRQPVERAAQDDRKKARIAAFGVRQFRQVRPGEQRAGSEQDLAPRSVHGKAAWSSPQKFRRHHEQRQGLGAALGVRDGFAGIASTRAGPARSRAKPQGLAFGSRPANSLAMSSRCGTPSIHAASVSGQPFGAGGRHSDSPSVACTPSTRPMFQGPHWCSRARWSGATC